MTRKDQPQCSICWLLFLLVSWILYLFVFNKGKRNNKIVSGSSMSHPWNCQTRWFRNVIYITKKWLIETKSCSRLTTGHYLKMNSNSQTGVLAFLTHDGNLCSGGVGGLHPGSSMPASELTASLFAVKCLISYVPASSLTRPPSVSIFSSTL